MNLLSGKRKCRVKCKKKEKRSTRTKDNVAQRLIARQALTDIERKETPSRGQEAREISGSRTQSVSVPTNRGLTNVTGKIARKESLRFVYQHILDKPIQHALSPPQPHVPPRPIPSHSVQPVTEKSTKAPLRQHASPMSAFTLRVSQ